jgi:hypothetical protein
MMESHNDNGQQGGRVSEQGLKLGIPHTDKVSRLAKLQQGWFQT